MSVKFTKKELAKYVLVIGIISAFIFPIVFAYISPIEAFKDTGQIGDTIGGMTAPLVSIMGSILLYLALSDQLEANKILSEQIKENKEANALQHELGHISELYRLFEKNIDLFTYEEHKSNNKNVKLYAGSIAISRFVDHLILHTQDAHDDKEAMRNEGAHEFLSILKSAELLVDKIKRSTITEEDKIFYKSLILHKIEYNLSPNFSRIEEYFKQKLTCECGEDHGTFPIILFDEIKKLKTQLINI